MKSDSSTNHKPSGHGSTVSYRAEIVASVAGPDRLQSQPGATSASEAPASASHLTFRYCAHVTAAGRHCRMLAMVDSELCAHHSRAREKRLQKQPAVDKSMTDLLARIPRFEDPASVHHFIGDVVKQFAEKRISRQDALAMGYLCQLLLTSFSDHRKWRTRRR